MRNQESGKNHIQEVTGDRNCKPAIPGPITEDQRAWFFVGYIYAGKVEEIPTMIKATFPLATRGPCPSEVFCSNYLCLKHNTWLV